MSQLQYDDLARKRPWGLLELGAIISIGSLLVACVYLSMEAPLLALGLAVGPASLAVILVVARQRSWGILAVLLVLASLALNRSEGIQIIEVVFGFSYLLYFTAWYGQHVLWDRKKLIRSVGDAGVLALILMPPASLIMTVVFSGDFAVAGRELLAYSMFLFYFPVREYVADYAEGSKHLAAAFVLLGLASFVMNVLTLQEVARSAEYAWQVARARATANEMLLLSAAILGLIAGARLRGVRSWLWLAGFALFAAGVVLTGWRAYYVSLVLATAISVFFLPGASKMKAVGGIVGAALLGSISVYIILGDRALLLAYGLADRVSSIATAATVDVSYMNRMVETRAIMPVIWESPILGHGLGVSFSFNDVIQKFSWSKTYAHNGYLTILFRFGIVGIVALGAAWGMGLRNAWVAWSGSMNSEWDRVIGLFCFATFLSLVPSFAVSNPFATGDTTLAFTLMLAAVSGVRLHLDGSAAC